MGLPITFRLAIETDLVPLAVMHVQAWREAYRGLMPDAVLDALDPANREVTWRETLRQGTPVTLAFSGNAIVGFMGCGERRDAALPAEGEIYGLYVLELAHRQGIGAKLLLRGLDFLANNGFNSAALWVLEGNARARRFYEAQGGTLGAYRVEARDGWELGEVAYVWGNLLQRHHSHLTEVAASKSGLPTLEDS